MQTSVYISNRNLQVLSGSAGKRVRIKRVFQGQLSEGCLLNGVITDEEALRNELTYIWRQEGLPRQVRLVVGGSQFLTRAITPPKLKPALLQTVADKEFAGTILEESVADYCFVRGKGNEQQMLCCAAPRSYIKSYIDLFAGIGVKLSCISPAVTSLIRFQEASNLMRDSVGILMVLDEDVLSCILVEQGCYKYASRQRLFSQEGTAERHGEIAQTVAGLLQFQSTDKSGQAITDAYLAGCPEADFEGSRSQLEAFGVTAVLLPDAPVVSFPAGSSMCDFLFPLGDFFRE